MTLFDLLLYGLAALGAVCATVGALMIAALCYMAQDDRGEDGGED